MVRGQPCCQGIVRSFPQSRIVLVLLVGGEPDRHEVVMVSRLEAPFSCGLTELLFCL